jgi:hypothetical protein
LHEDTSEPPVWFRVEDLAGQLTHEPTSAPPSKSLNVLTGHGAQGSSIQFLTNIWVLSSK